MHIIIKNNIQLFNININLLKPLLSELIIDNPNYIEAVKFGRSTYKIDKKIVNFYVKNDIIYLPRGFIDRLIIFLNENSIIYTIENKKSIIQTNYIHSILPRQYQYIALENITKHSEGILVAPAGSGKTVMGIAMAVMSSQKLLWITHTTQLADQFKERLLQFTDIKIDDVGFIGSGKWNIGDKVTIGLVQTLSKSNKLIDIQNTFGIVIVDEMHHVPSITFTKVISNLNPYYLFGLTATPYRRDKLEKLMFQTIGPIRHIIDRQEVKDKVITPSVKAIFLNNNIVGQNYADIIKNITTDDYRNNIIVSDVIYEYNHNNICIIVTDRKNQADILFKKIQKFTNEVGIATGNYKKELQKETIVNLISKKIKILVCTTQLLGEGFDYPPLNRLFIGTPFKNKSKCEQIVGRIQRVSDGKIDGIIYDYIDKHPIFKNQFKNFNSDCRSNVYKYLGCKIYSEYR
jgi:superfamily II DNA or RNA helicase